MTDVADVPVSTVEATALEGWCRRITQSPYKADADYDAELSATLPGIAPRIEAVAVRFGEALGASGVVRFRGLPIPDDLPATPAVPYDEVGRPTGTEALLIGLAALAGDVIAYKEWRGGHRVHNVYPLPSDANGQRASNAVRLAMHTEAAFLSHSPEALAILYLRDGVVPPPATAFCDLHRVWAQVEPADQQLLAEPAFCFAGKDDNGADVLSDPLPIAIPWRTGWRFHFVPAVLGATPFHEQALRRFMARIDELTIEVPMAPGDLALIDNVHVVHGRTSFQPRYDGTDRWLQRCLLRARQPAALRPPEG